ncbi:MAG: hypothetical protein ACK5XD_03290, partial [Acidobacteriota bacterium]
MTPRIFGLFLFVAALPAQPPKLKLWSLQPVARPAVPAGAAHPVDAFIGVQHRAKGLRPNGPADKLTLLRRATIDRTRGPPSRAGLRAVLGGVAAAAAGKR